MEVKESTKKLLPIFTSLLPNFKTYFKDIHCIQKQTLVINCLLTRFRYLNS